MKKITLLFSLCMFSLGYSQVVLTEDFESSTSIPTGWNNNDIAGNGEIWTIGTNGEAVGYNSPNTIYYDAANFSGNYALFNSDGYGSGPAESAALESPVFDCSSLTSVVLKYSHFFTAGFGGQASVEVYNGTTWVEVESYTTPPGGDQNDSEFGNVEVDVTSELAGVSNAQVRFVWSGNWSWGWAFDNVEVFQCTDAAPGITINPMPADAASNVVVTTTDNDETQLSFSWDAPATGGPVTDYLIVISDDPTLDPEGNTISGTFSTNNPGNIFLPGQNYFEVSTTYYWTVIPQNCAGGPSSDPTVWSFTTDSTLNNTEIEAEKVFEHFVSNNVLSISSNNQIDQVEIYNMLGQVVKTLQPNNSKVNVDLNELNNGMFISKVSINGQTQTFKFVK